MRASATGSSSGAPRATARASSSAAEDDSPAPTGTVEATAPTKPVAGRNLATTAATTEPKAARAGDFRGGHIERDGGDRLELVRREHDLASAELADDLDEPVDSRRQHEPSCVVGVVADQVDPPGATHRSYRERPSIDTPGTSSGKRP